MNRLETAKLLVERKVHWPATIEAEDSAAEVDVWSAALAPFDVELVREVMLQFSGQFGPTLSELKEPVLVRARGRSRRPGIPHPATQECPTCSRSPFGPHRGVDPCRTCGRDDAPQYARMPTPTEEAIHG